MPLTLNLSAVAATTATIGFAGEAADGYNEIQYSIRPDFKFCVAPMFYAERGAPANIAGLNQNTTYFFRGRASRATGAKEAWSETESIRTLLAASPVTAPASVMIKPATLVVPAHVLRIVCETDVDGYPAANLGYDAPVAWRSHGAATPNHYLLAEIGPEPVDTVALLMSNIPEGATWRVIANNSGWGDGPLFETGVMPFRASANIHGRPGWHGLYRAPELQLFSHWMIHIQGAFPGGILHAEHLVIGRNRATKNHSYDKSETGLDLGSLERTRSGNPNRANGYRMRRVDFDISMMSEAQYETQYGDLHWRVGGTDPVLVVPNSKDGAFLHDRILYGPITAGRVVNPATPVYTRNFTIDSLI